MATSVGEIVVNAKLNAAAFSAGISSINKQAEAMRKNWGEKIGDMAKTASKVLGGGIAATGSLAIKAFSDYQQMTGGVQKLFGSAADAVIQNSQNAYKTAGLDANNYMDTVTGFSASLIKGLGGDTAKAAGVADTAIRDMSDNANTFGTSMASIQYTYQGFAKQNYTMLDNLKLGYGGTAAEMARLVNDSGVMGNSFKATANNINSVSFDKIIEAIHVTQERLNIAGTTAKEAGGTVEGSFNQMKAAAGNFLAALGGGGDVDKTLQELIAATAQFGANLVPVIKTIVSNVINIFAQMWADFEKNHPIISTAIEALAILIGTLLMPQLIKVAATTLLAGVNALVAGAQMLAGWMMALGPIGLIVAAIAAVIAIFVLLWNKFAWFRDGITAGLKAIGDFFVAIWNGIQAATLAVVNTIVGFFSGMWETLIAAINLYLTIWRAVFNAILSVVSGTVNTVVNFFSGMWNTVRAIVSGAPGFFGGVFRGAANAVRGAFSGIVGFFGGLWNSIVSLFGRIGTSVGNAIGGSVRGAINAVIRGAVNIINGFIGTINGAISVINAIPGVNIGRIGRLSAPGLATGGLVTGKGTSTSDSNPYMLSRGEYVVRAKAVDLLGTDTLDAINEGRLPAAGGGLGQQIQNYYYQFSQEANSRWQYNRVVKGAAN